MKKLLLSLLAGVAWSYTATAQLRNLDFEQWDYPLHDELLTYNRPSGWICSNRWFGFEEAAFSEKFVDPVDSIARHDDYALRLFTYYNYMKDAAVQTAPFHDRPVALQGFYKYEDNFILDGTATFTDTAQVVILLSRWNGPQGKRDTIGLGLFSASTPVAVFTEFNAGIIYTAAETPDSITILLDPSILGRHPDRPYLNLSGGGSSIFTIDHLFLVQGGVTGIGSRQVHSPLTIYPNPAKDVLHFKPSGNAGTLMDLNGRALLQFDASAGMLDISSLSQGLYLIRLSGKEGSYSGKFVKK